jgi:hypothetical protein
MSLCNKTRQQVRGTCYYYSVLNGLLTSSKIATIMKNMLDKYKSLLQLDRRLASEFDKMTDFCIPKYLLNNVDIDDKNDRYKMAKYALFKLINNHFKKEFNIDLNSNLLEGKVPGITTLPVITQKISYTDTVKDVEEEGSDIGFNVLKSLLKLIYISKDNYTRNVKVIAFDDRVNIDINRLLNNTNYDIVVLMKSLHQDLTLIIEVLFTYYDNKGYNTSTRKFSTVCKEEVGAIEKYFRDLENLTSNNPVFEIFQGMFENEKELKNELKFLFRYDIAKFLNIINTNINWIAVEDKLKYYNDDRTTVLAIYQEALYDYVERNKVMFEKEGLTFFMNGSNEFNFKEFSKYDKLIQQNGYLIDHANIIAGEGSAAHAIFGTKCNNKYIMIDQNRPDEILNNDWTKSLTNIEFNFYGEGYAWNSPRVRLNAKFSFVVYVNKNIQDYIPNLAGGKHYRLVKY